MFAFGIFKVIYSPLKAFKEIIQNPRFLGPFLILVLFIAAYTGSAYVVLSKTYDEKTLPTVAQGDVWTQNLTGWTSNAQISLSNDAINGSFFGNRSLQFSVSDDSLVRMHLNLTQQANCSGSNGFKSISVRAKLDRPNAAPVQDVAFYLFSSPTDYFSFDLTQYFVAANSSRWNNLTIPVGPDTGWITHAGADWNSISELELGFSMAEVGNYTVRVGGLVFRGIYQPFTGDVAVYLFSFGTISVMEFVVRWIFVGGLLFIFTRLLQTKLVWKVLLVSIGFVLITLLIQSVINIILYANLPAVNYPLEAIAGPPSEINAAMTNALAGTVLIAQLGVYIEIAIHVWAFVLCAIVIRLLTEFSWAKSSVVAVIGYAIGVLVERLFIGV